MCDVGAQKKKNVSGSHTLRPAVCLRACVCVCATCVIVQKQSKDTHTGIPDDQLVWLVINNHSYSARVNVEVRCLNNFVDLRVFIPLTGIGPVVENNLPECVHADIWACARVCVCVLTGPRPVFVCGLFTCQKESIPVTSLPSRSTWAPRSHFLWSQEVRDVAVMVIIYHFDPHRSQVSRFCH